MVLETQEQLRDAPHVEGLQFKCAKCGLVKSVQASGGTGYGYMPGDNRPVCYLCCGDLDREVMLRDGKITLYLTCEPVSKALWKGRAYTAATLAFGPGRSTLGKVSNWPGTLEFPCYTTYGKHNIAGVRYDAWFTGPDGFEWHGVTYGNNTQVCHCRRTKKKAQ
jgi:hypothetical protein